MNIGKNQPLLSVFQNIGGINQGSREGLFQLIGMNEKD